MLNLITGAEMAEPPQHAARLGQEGELAGPDPRQREAIREGLRGIELLLSDDPGGQRLLRRALAGLSPGMHRALFLGAAALHRARTGADAAPMLEQALREARMPSVCRRAPEPQGDPRCDVRVALDGAWLWRAEREPVSLLRRRVLRSLLSALARGLAERPGEALSRERLIEQGWPGERRPGGAPAVNRFHVALSTLRRLGLGGALGSTPEGWRLDPQRDADRLRPRPRRARGGRVDERDRGGRRSRSWQDPS